MANGEKKSGTKIAERAVFDAQGEEVLNYKEGVKASYKHLASGAGITYDFGEAKAALADALDEQRAAMIIAFACEGLITKTGHAVNKATNGSNATGDVRAALEEFQADVIEGSSWTNREGGGEIGADDVIAAIAELNNKPVEGVAAYWRGGEYNGKRFDPLDKESKTAWRTNDQIKAIVARQRAARAEQRAAASRQQQQTPTLGF